MADADDDTSSTGSNHVVVTADEIRCLRHPPSHSVRFLLLRLIELIARRRR